MVCGGEARCGGFRQANSGWGAGLHKGGSTGRPSQAQSGGARGEAVRGIQAVHGAGRYRTPALRQASVCGPAFTRGDNPGPQEYMVNLCSETHFEVTAASPHSVVPGAMNSTTCVMVTVS